VDAGRDWRQVFGRWDEMTTSDWNLFAKEWLAELRQSSPPAESDEGRSATAADVGEAVVFMNFTAGPDQQWQFICSAVAQAESDDELGHIAAGPLEHLLGSHGENFIAPVEARTVADGKFARMVTGVWKHTMTDDVWARVQAIQATASNPLDG